MVSKQVSDNLTPGLKTRIEILEDELNNIEKERAILEDRRKQVGTVLQALKTSLVWESALHGEQQTPRPTAWWVGFDLKNAVIKLKAEHPEWKFEQIRDKLVIDGFDFKGKKPGNAVNMALISLRQKKSDKEFAATE